MKENNEFLKNFSKEIDKIFIFVGVIIIFIWLASGTYVVGPDEEGVVLRFGKYVKTKQSGMNWHLPYPIEEIITVKVKKRYTIEVGFRTIAESSANSPAKYKSVDEESVMLTGDENIVQLDAVITYEIASAKDYIFNVYNVPSVVKSAAEAAIRQIVGNSTLDNVLTEGKDEIQIRTKEKLQEVINLYETGIKISEFHLQDVEPPTEVSAAFKDVASAREDSDKFKKEAEGYRNDVLPRARGQAAQLINEALAYKVKRVEDAKGDVARFEKILETYKLGKEVTKTRLYLETLEKIMPNIEKTIIDEDIKNSLINIINKEGVTK